MVDDLAGATPSRLGESSQRSGESSTSPRYLDIKISWRLFISTSRQPRFTPFHVDGPDPGNRREPHTEGTAMAKMIFVNLPVKDLPAATRFYETIGF
jgi:hypothetical protein